MKLMNQTVRQAFFDVVGLIERAGPQGDMSQDEFAKLYAYMTERFDQIDAELAKKADGDGVFPLNESNQF